MMLVYFGIILIVLLAFCGLAIDMGRMELRTNQLQAVVDAAALAAAGELWHGGTGSNWQTAANNDVATIEAANNIPSTGAPTLQHGASYGPYVGDNSVVQATITQNFPTVFLGLISKASATITVKAVAQMPPCMVFLGSPALTSTYDYWNASAGSQTVPNYSCPEYFKDGLTIDGFANINGSQVRTSGSASTSQIQGGTTWPVIFNVPVISDPLAYIPARSVGTCVNSSPISYLDQSTGTTINLTPGTYCGKTAVYYPGPLGCLGTGASVTTPAVDIEGKYVIPVGGVGCPNQGATNGGNCLGNPTVNFSAGLYIFIGGINLNCVTVTGTGVTLYFTKSLTVAYGQVRMTSSTWNASAPTSGDPSITTGSIPGVTIMTDRNWVASLPTVTQDLQWNYSTWYGDGVIYSPATGISGYATSFSGPNYMNMVVSNLYYYDRGMNPSVNYSSLSAGNPLRTVVALVQ